MTQTAALLGMYAAALALSIAGCTSHTSSAPGGKKSFGTVDGKEVFLYTLRNAHGMEARITNYGGIIVSLIVPDKNGKPGDIVLGYDTLAGYLRTTPYFGAIVGRYANRIGKARFSLNGKEYALAANDGTNTLHGGLKAFDKVVWTVDETYAPAEPSLALTYVSKDGEEGFPGTLKVRVVYTVTDSNALRIEYFATSDAPTVLNLTNHSYFNLADSGRTAVLGHELLLDAGRFTPIDAGLIPTGEMRSVAGTPLDFRTSSQIGARIEAKDEQLLLARGYDHNWIIDRTGNGLVRAARVAEPKSGRVMEVWTTEPGIQFYTGNFLDGTITGKNGVAYQRRAAFCLETQHFPDSPNRPEFPTTVLNPGETFTSTTVYSFATQ
jgi:aldose 1-epimerase